MTEKIIEVGVPIQNTRIQRAFRNIFIEKSNLIYSKISDLFCDFMGNN
jgi:hypothetical protein